MRQYVNFSNITKVKQIHSNKILFVEKVGKYGECDGILTKNENIIPQIVTADCIPLFIYDFIEKYYGIIHCGWRGIASKIHINALEFLLQNSPLTVFADNVETVRRLTPRVRDPRATFDQSLLILRKAKEFRPDIMTKSSIMLGLGETEDDLLESFEELRNADVDLLTLGQYLSPGSRYHPVISFPTPETGVKLPRIIRAIVEL